MSAAGLNGSELEEELNKRNIWPELVTGNIVMCMTGIGTTEDHIEKLIEALKDIALNSASEGRAHEREQGPTVKTMFKLERRAIPE
jgi:arginine/lysine/ornithine decarboxylase